MLRATSQTAMLLSFFRFALLLVTKILRNRVGSVERPDNQKSDRAQHQNR